MARKSKPEGKKYNYMDTYGDLVTLLLCFFVLLFSMSVIDKARFNVLTEALGQQFGPHTVNDATVVYYVPEVKDDHGNEESDGDLLGPAEHEANSTFNQMADKLEAYIEQNQMQGDVQIQRGASGVFYIRLSNNLLFDGDAFALRRSSMEFLEYLGRCFAEVEQEIYNVNCVGHTASVQGSSTDSWILSGERAGIVASYLEKESGLPREKLRVTAYGRAFPIADNNDPSTRGANRRVDIVVINNDPDQLVASLLEASRVYFPDDDTQYFQGDDVDLPGQNIQVPPNGDADVSLPTAGEEPETP